MEHKLILTIGLPYSGKSRWAKHNDYRPIVNPDAIRRAMHGQRFSPEAEPLVWAIAKIMVRSLFFAGHETAIVDACHSHKERRDFWKDPYWKRQYAVMDVSVDECLARAKKARDIDIIASIHRMQGNWDLDGVFYGQDGLDAMDEHMIYPGPDRSQLYHEGTAKD